MVNHTRLKSSAGKVLEIASSPTSKSKGGWRKFSLEICTFLLLWKSWSLFLTRVEYQGHAAPLEVKGDRSGRLKSLHWYRSHLNPEKAFVVSSRPTALHDDIQWIPFYGLMRILVKSDL